MAAANELQKMLEEMRNPGMSRTETAGVAGQMDSRRRQPGMTSGVSSVPTASQAPGLSSDLNTMRSSQQRSRGATESRLNPAVGESLRLSLIEQQRQRKNAQGPGKMNPVEFRAMMAERGANQSAVDSGLAGLQSIRESAVQERGQDLGAATSLRDRQMQEAGAFDRSLLGLDETMLQGQFGLEQQRIQAEDPYADFTLDLLEQSVTSEDASPLDVMNAVNVARGLGPAQAPAGSGASIETPGGLTRTLSEEEALLRDAMNQPPEVRDAILRVNGYVMGEDGRLRTLAEAQAEERSRELDRQAQDWNERNSRKLEQIMQQRQNPGGVGAVSGRDSYFYTGPGGR